jgi:argininosuccinate lyase
MAGMVETMRVDGDRIRAAAPAGFSLATDVAEHLVRRGVAFREAHEAVGHLVVYCLAEGRELGEVTDEELQRISEHLTPDVRDVLSLDGALAARASFGGTAPARVAEQLAAVREAVAGHRSWATGGGSAEAAR